MQGNNQRAFKEWAAVVRAMEHGETILLIRKGGIVEEGGALRVDDPEFFLFPNHTHQDPARLQPRGLRFLEESEAQRPDVNTVRISSYAVTAGVFMVPDEDALARLDGEHIWTRETLAERLWYKPSHPLYAIALRAYILPAPFEVTYLAAYGGCTSWVTLDEPLPTTGAVPALSDREFEERLSRVRLALDPDGGTP